jgi:hypothetical protein
VAVTSSVGERDMDGSLLSDRLQERVRGSVGVMTAAVANPTFGDMHDRREGPANNTLRTTRRPVRRNRVRCMTKK